MLLDKLKTQLADVHFTFLASEGWGTHPKLIEGGQNSRGMAAAGTLVFVTHDSFYVDDTFKLYLENLTSLSSNRNPWLDQFWETFLNAIFEDHITNGIPNHVMLEYTLRATKLMLLHHFREVFTFIMRPMRLI